MSSLTLGIFWFALPVPTTPRYTPGKEEEYVFL